MSPASNVGMIYDSHSISVWSFPLCGPLLPSNLAPSAGELPAGISSSMEPPPPQGHTAPPGALQWCTVAEGGSILEGVQAGGSLSSSSVLINSTNSSLLKWEIAVNTTSGYPDFCFVLKCLEDTNHVFFISETELKGQFCFELLQRFGLEDKQPKLEDSGYRINYREGWGRPVRQENLSAVWESGKTCEWEYFLKIRGSRSSWAPNPPSEWGTSRFIN